MIWAGLYLLFLGVVWRLMQKLPKDEEYQIERCGEVPDALCEVSGNGSD